MAGSSPLRLALFLSCATLATTNVTAHDGPPARGRLVFSEHGKPVVRVLDLDTGEVTHDFPVPKSNATFITAKDGRHVVVRTGDASGTIRILDSGLVRESHGDHDDITKLEPRMLDVVLTGDKPSHVVSDHGQIAIFYDGERPWDRPSEPKVALVDVPTLGGTPAVRTWRSPAPQHGIAVPVAKDRLLVSRPNAAYARGDDRSASSRPDGFAILDTSGDPGGWKTVRTFTDDERPALGCALFHGDATLRGTHVFACREGAAGGLLAVSGSGGDWTARRIAYPDERRVSAIRGGAGRFLVGNYGSKSPYDALLRIDPQAAALAPADVLPVPDGQSACRFGVSADGRRVANLTPDGRLRVYDLMPAWKEVANFEAVPPFDCTFGAATPASDLTIIGQNAFVSDPTRGQVREYDLVTLKQGLDLPVDGMPTVLAGDAAGG